MQCLQRKDIHQKLLQKISKQRSKVEKVYGTVGSANLSEFFSAPYRTIYRAEKYGINVKNAIWREP